MCVLRVAVLLAAALEAVELVFGGDGDGRTGAVLAWVRGRSVGGRVGVAVG